MFLKIMMAAALATAAPITASAQYYNLDRAARDVYAACALIAQGKISDLRSACACLVGYYGGMMSDRDFALAEILLRGGALAEAGATAEEITAEIRDDLVSGGYVEADINRVASIIQQSSTRIDTVCAQFQTPGSV